MNNLLCLVVDDHVEARKNVAHMIYDLTSRYPIEADGYESAVKALQQHCVQEEITDPTKVFALVVVDQNLSETTEDLSKYQIVEAKTAGLDLITRVRALAPVATVGLHTAYHSTAETQGFAAKQAGADFYADKTWSWAKRSALFKKHLAGFTSRVDIYNKALSKA